MTYTEIKERNRIKYYYRVKSVREGNKVNKQRIYLGKNLTKKELIEKEGDADKQLVVNKNLELIKKKIIKVLKKYKVKKAGIFGSYVRGDQKNDSDIDVIILPPKDMSLLGLVHVKHELEDKIDKEIDLVSYRGIHPYLKKQILSEEVRII